MTVRRGGGGVKGVVCTMRRYLRGRLGVNNTGVVRGGGDGRLGRLNSGKGVVGREGCEIFVATLLRETRQVDTGEVTSIRSAQFALPKPGQANGSGGTLRDLCRCLCVCLSLYLDAFTSRPHSLHRPSSFPPPLLNGDSTTPPHINQPTNHQIT